MSLTSSGETITRSSLPACKTYAFATPSNESAMDSSDFTLLMYPSVASIRAPRRVAESESAVRTIIA